MNEPSVSVRNLTKSFSGRAVVDDLSFDVQKGEVFALLGHNGAGKSTTIDLILGLKTPNGGTAKILGMDAAKHRKQVFERVGVQLQNTQYQTSITVEEACIEYASLYAAPADYLQLLERFGLGALRKSFVSKLSGGERQKLSVVLALIGDPEIVFPAGLRAVSGWMPLGLGIKLLKSVSAGCYDNIVMPVATLTAIAVICGAVAVKTFRWE